MAATTTFTVALLLLLLLVAAPNAAKGNSFTVELIHRDSTRSPLSSHPDLSKPQRVRNAAARSLDRARSLERRLGLSSSVVSPMDAEAPVTADSGAYLVHVSLGTPAFPIVAIADTGSDVIWTQCQPCADCYTQTAPMFDPKSSTTYREISCSSETCTSLTDEGTSCSSDADVCHYQVTYGDGSNTSGDMATTTLTIVPKGVLSELADAVSSQVSGGTPVQVQGLDTCFEVEDSGSFEAPTLTMHFDGGADVELKTGNTFVEAEENVVCLAFAGSASLAIYGNVAQQNFRVGYDLKGETLSFEPADCTAGSSA
ncbi:unnamed protein product [Linum tenue]|uniref:Peptidase A1 domain-containing protein n=1 Tax=Linum tenue TaxID=586396 RepID=A0AAV0HQ87_9ROSI|nr:unnamed protein product [Linum tenue]